METPKITGSRYVLAVRDLAKSVDYYQNQLGFSSVWAHGGWHSLGREKFIVMLGECANEVPAFETGDHSYFAYIDVENIDELHREYTTKQVEIASKLADKPWGQREFGIRTVDGHRITFGQAITIHH
jgi:catechol 2,3-dioxygenase-like lactoylglutathione lyase family enzyme